MTLEEITAELQQAAERVTIAAQQIEFWTQEKFKALGVHEHLLSKQQAQQLATPEPTEPPTPS